MAGFSRWIRDGIGRTLPGMDDPSPVLRAEITSAANERLRAWAKLLASRHRRQQGRFLVEGREVLVRAGEAGMTVETLLASAALPADEVEAMAARLGAGEVVRLRPGLLGKVSVRQHPADLVGVACTPGRGWERSLPGDGLLVVADHLEKPGNLGALARTARAAGAAGLVLSDPLVDPENPAVLHASRGHICALPVWEGPAEEVRARLRAEGYRLVAADPEGASAYTEVSWPSPLAVVLGEEHRGLGAAWRGPGVERVRIPMAGGVDSLNVSVSGALLLYEYARAHDFPLRR